MNMFNLTQIKFICWLYSLQFALLRYFCIRLFYRITYFPWFHLLRLDLMWALSRSIDIFLLSCRLLYFTHIINVDSLISELFLHDEVCYFLRVNELLSIYLAVEILVY